MFQGKHVLPIRGYFFFGYGNTVVNCKEAHLDDGREGLRASGNKKKIIGIEEALFCRRKGILDI